MKKNKKYGLLYNHKIFYTIAFITGVFGFYIAKIIESQHKMVANGILGLLVPYLLYIAFVAPRNKATLIEIDDLVFPRDLKYFLYSFLWPMIIYWAFFQVIDSARYLLHR